MNELWKLAVGYEEYFEVSNIGNIKAFPRKWITGRNTERQSMLTYNKVAFRGGYLYKSIRINGKMSNILLHRLIASTFIPNPFNLAQVNHIDGNKLNNSVENLEWISPGDNQRHAYKLGLKTPTDHSRPILQYSLNGEFLKTWKSLKEITDTLGYDRSAIIRVAKNKQKTSYGFKWKYLKERKTNKCASEARPISIQ